MNSLSLLQEFLGHLLIASEEATVSGEEPQGSVRRCVTDHEIRHCLVIIQIPSTDWTLELNPHVNICLIWIDPYAYKENP